MQEATSTQTFQHPYFYMPGDSSSPPEIIDQCVVLETGATVGAYTGASLEQLQKCYPGGQVGERDAIMAAREKAHSTLPTVITETAFHDALEVLPPEGYRSVGQNSSFKMCEYFSGRVTSIYAFVESVHYTFRDVHTITHEEIVAKIRASLKPIEQPA